MKKIYLLASIKKNGFLVYKNTTKKDWVIKKRSDYTNEELFKEACISFTTKQEAETFIKEHKLLSVEVAELEQ